MDRWQSLFDRFNQSDRLRRQAEAQARAEAEARRAFDAWCASTTDRIMTSATDIAKKHAIDFQNRTGSTMVVAYPGRKAIDLTPNGPHLSFLRLELPRSRVDLYAHRGPGLLPFFHFLPSIPGASGHRKLRNRVIASIPVCYAARLADNGYQLRRAIQGLQGCVHEPLSLEDLVYYAFDLLFEGVDLPLPVVLP